MLRRHLLSTCAVLLLTGVLLSFSLPDNPAVTAQNLQTPELTDPFFLSDTPVPYTSPTLIPTTTPSDTPSSLPTQPLGVTSTPLPVPAFVQSNAVLPPEPELFLLYTNDFNEAAGDSWIVNSGWAPVATESGQALQASNSPLTFDQLLGDTAIQFRASTSQIGLLVRLRESSAGFYAITIDPNGYLTLSRNEVVLASAALPPSPWHTVRVSAFGGALRINVDGSDIATAIDPSPLPVGSLSIAPIQPVSDGASLLLVDDLNVWIPASAMQANPSPAMAPLVLTALCSPDPSVHRVWQIHNTNSTNLTFMWEVENAGQTGSSVALALSDTTFRTFTVSGSTNTVRIYVDGILQDAELSDATLCSSTVMIDDPVDLDPDVCSKRSESIRLK